MNFNKNEYILTFLAHGVSVFITDIHVDVYKELEVLFLIDDGMFKQYFTQSAYEAALDNGLKFYSDEKAFINYKTELESHCKEFDDFFVKEIAGKKKLNNKTVEKFFNFTIKLCKDYTKMNVEFTDKAFIEQKNDPIIKKNLLEASKFKDWVRSYMNKVLFEPDGYASKFFIILSKQFDLQPYILHNLTQEEILTLFNKKLLDVKMTSQRQNAFAINYDRSHFYQGQNALAIIEQFKDHTTATNVVSGKVANPGKTKGKVKVITVDYSDSTLLNNEIDKMDKGDILIAQTTAPELIVACHKAAAIVTDLGGLLSHAAIVSIEFRIPCIVGTGNATSVFKDGDIVEVDGNRGIVTKIH